MRIRQSAPTLSAVRTASWRALIAGAVLGLSVLALALPSGSLAQTDLAADAPAALPTAPVVIDHDILFSVRGVSALPAPQRANIIAERIKDLARDRSIDPATARVVETPGGSNVMVGDTRVVQILDADAAAEGIGRHVFAEVIVVQVRNAITRYRQLRAPATLIRSGALAAAGTLLFVAAVVLVVGLGRRLRLVIDRYVSRKLRDVEIQHVQVLPRDEIRAAMRSAMTIGGAAIILGLVYAYTNYVMALFPWTYGIAGRLVRLVLDPLATVGSAIVSAIPNLILIAIIVILARFVARAARTLFAAVDKGQISFARFEPEWAMPTYKLVRLGIILFAIVLAYPFIPGSESRAFQGLSIFLGVILSLGSTSVIANIIAGYTMTYRQAYRIGDRVRIEETIGEVVDMRLLVTRVLTDRNELVAVPNTVAMNSPVVNYSARARQGELYLSVSISVGYDVPWRKVEAMLFAAADRTPGLLKTPPPFVLETKLGDYAVTYELFAPCGDATAMLRLHADLCRNILDASDEHGIQIMTPMQVSGDLESGRDPKERRKVRDPHIGTGSASTGA